MRPYAAACPQPVPTKRPPNERPAPPVEPPLESKARIGRRIAALISELHERVNRRLNQLATHIIRSAAVGIRPRISAYVGGSTAPRFFRSNPSEHGKNLYDEN
jgi:hypothetical protein